MQMMTSHQKNGFFFFQDSPLPGPHVQLKKTSVEVFMKLNFL